MLSLTLPFSSLSGSNFTRYRPDASCRIDIIRFRAGHPRRHGASHLRARQQRRTPAQCFAVGHRQLGTPAAPPGGWAVKPVPPVINSGSCIGAGRVDGRLSVTVSTWAGASQAGSTDRGNKRLVSQKTLMVEAGIEVGGLRLRVDFIATLPVAKLIVVYLTVSDAFTISQVISAVADWRTLCASRGYNPG